MIKESVIKRKILKALNALPYSRFFSVQQGRYSESGISDIVGCYRGFFVALEVKTPIGRLSAKQELFLSQIAICSGCSAVVRSVEDAMEIINEIEKWIPRAQVPRYRMVSIPSDIKENTLSERMETVSDSEADKG